MKEYSQCDERIISYEEYKKLKNKNIEGFINYNNFGTKMMVVKDNGFADILVKFIDDYGYIKKTDRRYFLKGRLVNPYDKSLYGKGFIGIGNYKTHYKKDGKLIQTPQYVTWEGMLKRCYNNKYQTKEPTYKDCTVCEEWHNFQVFAEWYDDNYYEVENEKMQLDKDILFKGNKIYSPETSIFVSSRINSLFSKSDSIRGEYPIGVTLNKKTGKFISKCRLCNGERKVKYIGSYNTCEEAFMAYKEFKENLIKYVANLYKDKIPNKLYESLIKYEVEIND